MYYYKRRTYIFRQRLCTSCPLWALRPLARLRTR
jgi:hypothetical protein